ncbi:MAG: hypothetical protein ACWA5W_07740 [Phycisphaerales bacterium]
MTKEIEIKHQISKADRLGSLIEQADSLMGQLKSLSKEQALVIESGDVAQIIEMVSLREPIVQGLVLVGEEIGAFIENTEAMAQLSAAQRREALSQIAAIEGSMKEVRQQDERDQAAMEKVRDAMADQMSMMGAGQNALRAYSSRPSAPNPILQDRQG